VVAQLIKKGNVSRGWLGVSIQPVTEEIAHSFGLKNSRGALVSDILAGGPAEKAGIKQGDIITRLAGKEIKDPRQLQLVVAEISAGQKVDVEVFRAGKPLTLPVTISGTDSAAALQPRSTGVQAGWFGLTVEEIPRNMRIRVLAGLLVAEVEPDGMAAEAGLQRGDIIVSVNQKRVANLSEYGKAMQEAERKGSVAFLVKRGENSIYFALKIR
jgi:S1-C subfamily serine protease